MANWYTSTRNGNDNTGDGSIASPYATIFKAASVATTGDTINTEGDALTNSGVTVTASGAGSGFATSSSLVGVLAAGSIFTVDDPVLGIGKRWFKVRSVSSTSVTCNQSVNFRADAADNIELYYVATPSYSTNGTPNVLEDLSSLTLDGINFEGGWNEDFTLQDRITWATFVTGSSSGGVPFLRLASSGIAS
jgi:hypothetical protein